MEESSADVVSIAELRTDAQRVTTGYFAVALLPVLLALMFIRDYAQWPEWLSLAAAAAFFILGICILQYRRDYTSRMLRATVWVLGAFGALLLLSVLGIVGAAVAFIVFESDTWLALSIGASALVTGFGAYWIAIGPWQSARRLLRARLPPTGISFTAAMEPLGQQLPFTDWTVGQSAAARTGLAYRLAAVALGVPGFIGIVLVLLRQEFLSISSGLSFGAWFAALMLLRRGAYYSAIEAADALRRDARAPILYLRSFMDDALDIQPDQTLEMLTRPFRRLSPKTQWGERLEEVLALAVRRRGPFVAIANPNDNLPRLGAARAHHGTETWQNAIVEWVQMAQLIVQVAGPTSWIRWELETILSNGAGAKLLVLFPPGSSDDRSARYENFNDVLKTTAWGPAFGSLDRESVVGIRLLDGGRMLAVNGGKFQSVDYRLAVGILLGAIPYSS